jgi:hypothetical protein
MMADDANPGDLFFRGRPMRRLRHAMVLAAAAGGFLAAPVAAQLTAAPAGGRAGRSVPLPPGALAQPVVETMPEAPMTGPADPCSQELLSRLHSGDAGQREQARKQLEQISHVWETPELLQKMQAGTDNAELKEAIEDRLNEIKAHQMQLDIMHLPPITLNVNNASLEELTTALNEALHAPNTFMSAVGRGGFGGGGRYTLEAKEKPFWEVWAALSQQQPLTLQTSTTGTRLASGGMRIQRYGVDGPTMAYVGDITFQRTIDLQAAGGEGPSSTSMTAQVTFAVDPRVRVAQMISPTVTRAVDSEGNSLLFEGGSSRFGGAVTNLITFTLPLKPPSKPGLTMSMTLEGRVSAVATEALGTLKDLENNNGAALTVAGRTFTMQRFTINGNTISLSLNSTGAQPGNVRAQATILDGAGNAIWSYALTGGVGSSIPVGNSTGPYKLEMRVPDKMVDIPVKMELKDVPLP